MTASSTAGLPSAADLPSAAVATDAWERIHAETIALLTDLIRIPSVNPPDPPGQETVAARFIAAGLADVGVQAEILEPVTGRGSVAARLHGDGTGGSPLLLLSHLDVVPAGGDDWTHDPFGGDVADGYVWGRGAVDMKDMVAMELAVIRQLAREARAAGRDPASDPVPGLRRDVLFCSTADEEAGGLAGAGWIVDERPDLVSAAGALNECGGVSFDVAGRRFYGIGAAEKGYAVFRLRVRGTWGHGSMPRDDNAAVLAAEIVRRIAVPGPPRVTPLVQRLIDEVAVELPDPAARVVRELRGDCDASLVRAMAAIVRDTASPTVLNAGIKYNVIPGEAIVEIDCRTLPGSDGEAMEAELRRRVGDDDLWSRVEIESVIEAPSVEAPASGDLWDACVRTLRDHDPAGVPVPVMVPFATDAKHLARIGVPSYGFSPLRLEPGERFLERFHGTDERVGLDALRFGVPVLYDVVRRFCG